MYGRELILLFACAAPSEAERLAAALAAPTWEEARAACLRLAEPGPCLVSAAEAHARLDRADCDAVADPFWRDECVFRFAERAAKAGHRDDAVEACEATRFGRECTFHLIREDARAVLHADIRVAADAIAPWHAVRLAPDAPRLFWKTWHRERLADGIPVDPSGCADDPCLAGAREAIFMTMSAVARATKDFCASPPPEGTLAGRVVWVDSDETREWVDEWARNECIRRDRSPGP